MQAILSPLPPLELRTLEPTKDQSGSSRSRSGAQTSLAMDVEDHELEEDADGLPPVLEVSEEEFDELAEPVPSGAVDLTGRVAAALAASTRAEANLKALFRTVKFLGASIGAARETNAHLLSELTELHGALAEDSACDTGEMDAQTTMLTRATLLEQALREATDQAVREREFLIAEHDAFIASLVADHEQELSALRRQVADLEDELSAQEADDEWDDSDDDSADDEEDLSRGWVADD